MHPLLADTAAQELSTVLWSSAKLGFSPDDAVPGMVRDVTDRFWQMLNVAEEKHRPNEQNIANALWALAKMGHPAAAEVLGSVTINFAHLVRSPNAKQQPGAQAVVNVVWALGTLKHTPSDDKLLDQFCTYFCVLLRSQDQRTRPDAQEIANTLWALQELKHAPSHDVVSAMLDLN